MNKRYNKKIIFYCFSIAAIAFLLYVAVVSFSIYRKTNQKINALREPCFESSTVDFSNVGVYSGTYQQIITPPFGTAFLYLHPISNKKNLDSMILEGLICNITFIDSSGEVVYKGIFDYDNYSDSTIGLGNLELDSGNEVCMFHMKIGDIPVGTYELKIEVEKGAEKLRSVDYDVVVKSEISVLPILEYISLLIFVISLILLFVLTGVAYKKVKRDKK